MERKPIKSVEDFEVYQKAVKLFEDFLEEDLSILKESFLLEYLGKFCGTGYSGWIKRCYAQERTKLTVNDFASFFYCS